MDPATIAALASFGSSLMTPPSLPYSAQPGNLTAGNSVYRFGGVHLGGGGGGTGAGKDTLLTASLGTGSNLTSKIIGGGLALLLVIAAVRAAA